MSLTKVVKCTACDEPLRVQKYAPNKQTCVRCSGGTGLAKREVVEMRPVDKLRRIQELLGQLGYAMTAGRGIAKQYQDADAVVRIEPYMDNGTSLDRNCTIEGFVVVRQEFIPINAPDLNNRIPKVAQPDIHAIMTELELDATAQAQTHIDQVKCSRCGQETPEWVMLKDNQFLCLRKCAPVRRPYNA